MACAGGQQSSFIMETGSRIATTDIGFIQIAAGIGFRIIRGAGQRFTMAVGFIIRNMAGAGGRTQPGDRHGSRGVIPAIIVAGRRCHRTRLYQSGVGIVFQGRNVSVGFDFGLNAGEFTFVRTRDFCDPHPRQHRIGSGEVGQFYDHTTVINNFDVRDHNFVNRGIDPERITAVTRTPIHQVEIRETTTQSRVASNSRAIIGRSSSIVQISSALRLSPSIRALCRIPCMALQIRHKTISSDSH